MFTISDKAGHSQFPYTECLCTTSKLSKSLYSERFHNVDSESCT